jgi:hypothetical protein
VNAPHGSWGTGSLTPNILLVRVVRYAFLAEIYNPFLFLHSLGRPPSFPRFLRTSAFSLKLNNCFAPIVTRLAGFLFFHLN